MSFGQNNFDESANLGGSETNFPRGASSQNPPSTGYNASTQGGQPGALGNDQSGTAYGQSGTGFNKTSGGKYGNNFSGTGGYGQSATGGGGYPSMQGQSGYGGNPGDNFPSDNASYGKTQATGNTSDPYGGSTASAQTGTGAFGGSDDQSATDTGEANTRKISTSDKVRGGVEKLVGKATSHTGLMDRGQERATGSSENSGY